MLNPPEVLAWNSHKGYLVELADAGVPVVPTRLVRAGGDAELADGEAGAALVVKPAVSSGSRGAERFEAGDPAAAAHLAELVADRDALVQPYVASVAEQRRAVADLLRRRVLTRGRQGARRGRLPRAGDVRRALPRAHARRRPRRPRGRAPWPRRPRPELLYARVDLVEAATGPRSWSSS